MTTTTATLNLDALDSSPDDAASATSNPAQHPLTVEAHTREGRASREASSADLQVRRQRLRALDLFPHQNTRSLRQDSRGAEDTHAGTADARVDLVANPIQILQRWDGIVLSIGDETFRARLFDPRSGRPEVEAEIYVSDIALDDRPLLRPNAFFYWHMGYRNPHGDRERVSKIRFQRLPPKGDFDLGRARSRAEARQSLHGWS